MVFEIAIDGPAGSGKSTVSEIVKEKLGFQRINSGNIYRAVTYALLDRYGNYDLDDPEIIEFIKNLSLDLNKDSIIYNGVEISGFLRSKNIDIEVMKIAKPKYVREKVHCLQNFLIKTADYGLVMEGRDIGTNVLPNATLKIFLTASPEVRAKRRHNERPSVSYDETLKDIKRRDYEDINRVNGPLIVAPDAIVVNTDNYTAQESAEVICNLFLNKTR